MRVVSRSNRWRKCHSKNWHWTPKVLLKAAEVGLVRLLYSSLGHDAAGRSLPRRGGEDRRGGGTVGRRPRGCRDRGVASARSCCSRSGASSSETGSSSTRSSVTRPTPRCTAEPCYNRSAYLRNFTRVEFSVHFPAFVARFTIVLYDNSKRILIGRNFTSEALRYTLYFRFRG